MITITTFVEAVIQNGARILKVLGRGRSSDARTVRECLPFGIDSGPIAKLKAFFTSTEIMTSRDVILGYENKQPKAEPGEIRLYATDASGALKFNIWLRGDGSLLIGQSDDPSGYVKHFVQYESLEQALTTYFTDLNASILAGVGSAGGTYTEPVNPFDMSASKLTNVKTA